MAYLNPTRVSIIDKAVEQMVLNTGLSYPKDSLLDIAKALGVEVVSAELPDLQTKKVKGYIKWLSDEEKEKMGKPYRAKIYLNSNQADTTKTFTLAHELGHFLLHKDTNNFRIDLEDYSESDPDNQETEANYFASCLLMPKDKFFNALNNAKGLDQVAEAFGVSVPAVEARMKWLHIGTF